MMIGKTQTAHSHGFAPDVGSFIYFKKQLQHPFRGIFRFSIPSSPSLPRPNANKTFQNKIYNLKVLNINCRSIVNKKAEFYALLDKHKTDIVVGTESWLTLNHIDSEVFPKSLGFALFKQDRELGTSGGGVFILVKDTPIASEQKQLKTECEIILVNFEMTTIKPLYVAVYYKQRDGDNQSAAELRRSLELVHLLKGNTWLLGDFDYPKFSWDQDHVPTMKSGSSLPTHYDDFVSLLDDFSL